MPTTLARGILLFGFVLTDVGIAPAPKAKAPSFEDWSHLGNALFWFEDRLPWLIGGWVAYGEDRFGERASQAVALTGWKKETVQQYAWVHDRVPAVRRVPALSFAHHRTVATLGPADQTIMLGRAAADQWSERRLQREVQALKHPDQIEYWVVVRCTSPQDRETFIAKMEAEGRSVKVPDR